MNKFKTLRIGDVADVQTGPFGTQLHKKDYVSNGTPIITVEHLGENRIIDQNTPFVSDHDKDRLKKFVLQEDDIVFSRVGSVDRRAIVRKKEDGWLFSGRCLRVRFFDNNIDPKYVSYYMGLNSFKKYIRGIAVGATMPSLNTKILSSLEISIPLLPTQKRIAAILSAFDDKIENNRRICATLENIAQTIFREQFQKEEYRKTNLGYFLKPIKGKNITKAQAIDGPYPVIAGGLQPSCYHNDFNTKSPVITISASGANAGYVQLHHTPIWSSDSSYIDEDVTPFVYFFYTFLKINQSVVFGKQEGSAQPHVYPRHIQEIKTGEFETYQIEAFEKMITSYYEKIKNIQKQSETLEQLRSILLPKLMSGEIEI